MRFALPTGILLCFLATRFPGYNAGVVPALFNCRTTECIDEFTGPVIADRIIRRAGGKPGGTNSNGGSGGAGGTGGTDGSGSGTSQNDDTNTGESGSLGNDQETEGGFGASSGNGEGSSEGANNPSSLNAPSVRNNYSKPATAEGAPTYSPPKPINVQDKVALIKEKAAASGRQNGPWFFDSRFNPRTDSFDYMDLLSVKENTGETWSMDHIKPDEIDLDFPLYQGTNENYFWANYSKAYAQAV